MIPTGTVSFLPPGSEVRGQRSDTAAALQLAEIEYLLLANISRVDLCRQTQFVSVFLTTEL